jgi:hypothetical protein
VEAEVDTEGEVEAVEEDLVAVVGEVDIVMKARLKKLSVHFLFLFPCSLLSRVVTESPSVEIRLFCALLNKLGNQESDHFWTLGLFPPSFLYDLGILGFFIFVSAL